MLTRGLDAIGARDSRTRRQSGKGWGTVDTRPLDFVPERGSLRPVLAEPRVRAPSPERITCHQTGCRRRHVVSGNRRRARRAMSTRYLAGRAGWTGGAIRAVIAPHAGLMFSGPVGAHAYKAARPPARTTSSCWSAHRTYVAFDGVAIYPEGAFDTPLGEPTIDAAVAQALTASPVVQPMPAAHQREHSLEMQLPFVRRLFPDAPIVPLVMGYQTVRRSRRSRRRWRSLARASEPSSSASTDLSHYFDARTGADARRPRAARVAAFDPTVCSSCSSTIPKHERGRYVACGGGPAIAVMMAARALGAPRRAGAASTRTRARSRATTPASSAIWPRPSATFGFVGAD